MRTVPLARAWFTADWRNEGQAPSPVSDMLTTLAGVSMDGMPSMVPPEAQTMASATSLA